MYVFNIIIIYIYILLLRFRYNFILFRSIKNVVITSAFYITITINSKKTDIITKAIRFKNKHHKGIDIRDICRLKSI